MYEHIFGVRFFYSPKSIDTLFYEHFDFRNGEKTFDPKTYKLLYGQIDESTLVIAKDKDTLHAFSVLQGAPGRVASDAQMTNLPSIKKADDHRTYIASSWITSALKNDGKRSYFLILEGGEKIAYQLNNGCSGYSAVVSFINVEDGRVYFIEKGCWLEIVDTNDVNKLKNFH